MLKDPVIGYDPIIALLDRPWFKEEVGVYQGGFNFNGLITNIKGDAYFSPTIKRLNADRDWQDCISEYGVADNLHQIKSYYAGLIDDPEVFVCISYAIVRKDTEPESGGWRWHKWGSYIGDKDRQHEYLYDEPEIDQVLVFHLTELED